jgi:transposase
MRQSHVGGDKLFVDNAGDTVPVIVDRFTESRLSFRTSVVFFHPVKC